MKSVFSYEDKYFVVPHITCVEVSGLFVFVKYNGDKQQIKCRNSDEVKTLVKEITAAIEDYYQGN